ncbi:PREDICTED: Fc receptor-like protein 4 [Pseudopodoces humilis]|uniref:Fc receptor-like protein 4 n=1 Tax=Pseudopodoces humilis TaxID=181119 RepID=UPI0006B6A306|nr:PREDICTED: Fc receptor-like protein 4 [Pseudopodoces humilis]
MAARVALLLWAQSLGLAGAPSPQLLVEPPWRPAVLWDRVTLTCRGSGTAGDTTWYKDGRRWRQKGPESFTVTESGTYQCDRAGTGRSPPVTVSDGERGLGVPSPAAAGTPRALGGQLELLVLQVPAGPLLEGDTVTLRCRSRWDDPVTGVWFYHEEKDLGESRWEFLSRTSLSPLRLQHSGRYRCQTRWSSWSSWWVQSEPVSVTVHELFPVPVLEAPAELIAGSPLKLSCLSSRSPLRPLTPLVHRFYRDGRELGGPQGSPQLLLPALGVSGSGNYSCEVQSQGGAVRKSSAPLRVTVLVPVANATISPGALGQQVRAGEPVRLRCSVQVGSAPVTFTWLRHGREVARGPLLELAHVGLAHSGTYQCVATNQLGQDGHRVFRALSPELLLEVTAGGHGDTVAAALGGSLLFLLLLTTVIVAFLRTGAGKQQPRAPPAEDPQATYSELLGPHGQPWELSNIYETLQQKL